jgi:hypothetical protein
VELVAKMYSSVFNRNEGIKMPQNINSKKYNWIEWYLMIVKDSNSFINMKSWWLMTTCQLSTSFPLNAAENDSIKANTTE